MPVATRKRAVNSFTVPAAGTAAKRSAAGRPKMRSKQEPLYAPPVTATMSSKGQVVIPAPLRKKYRLEEGVTVSFREENGHIVLEPDRFAAFYALQGSVPFDLERALMEEKKHEREYEDRER